MGEVSLRVLTPWQRLWLCTSWSVLSLQYWAAKGLAFKMHVIQDPTSLGRYRLVLWQAQMSHLFGANCDMGPLWKVAALQAVKCSASVSLFSSQFPCLVFCGDFKFQQNRYRRNSCWSRSGNWRWLWQIGQQVKLLHIHHLDSIPA